MSQSRYCHLFLAEHLVTHLIFNPLPKNLLRPVILEICHSLLEMRTNTLHGSKKERRWRDFSGSPVDLGRKATSTETAIACMYSFPVPQVNYEVVSESHSVMSDSL